ncbi:MAG: 2-phospho-L-lactate transferase [Pleurocapsa minor GSE-CHR-MK-17-07R]|nr:2-phospho-L-lactate transferase [Pleurocapsa minor GSE-CHR-MK 17-07R]
MALKTELRVVALVGGVGGAKLAYGLSQLIAPENLTILVNNGDDFWHYGLRICPDLDTVMYTLSGLVDKTNGWGVAGDTIAMLDALRNLGEQPWFRLGDRDLATHLVRTSRLRAGESLTDITRSLSAALGIQASLLPVTNDDVPTIVSTREYGDLDFQTYFVRYRWQPSVSAIRYQGAESARLSDSALAAIQSADLILIAPSNPWLSVGPMLAIPPMREALLARDVPRIAISPIVAGQAIKGPAAKLMAELGYSVTPHTVAAYYGDIINGFVYDRQDSDLVVETVRTLVTDTVMKNEADRVRLAGEILAWAARDDVR